MTSGLIRDTTADVRALPMLVAIVGAGVMGRGIARVLAQGGVDVLLHDAREGVAAQAAVDMHHELQGAVSMGRLSSAAAGDAMSRVQVATALSDLRHATVVIEAIVEELAAKQALFGALEEIVNETCVLATNTSSLSVTAIAAACTTPQRIIGLHFFNPVPAMRLVEVIDGLRTHASVGVAMLALAQRVGHTAVRVRDTPGFLVNHAGRGYGTEALRIVGESVAEPHVIDTILRAQAGFRLGPFDLFDLVGLDVSVPVMESVYRQFWFLASAPRMSTPAPKSDSHRSNKSGFFTATLPPVTDPRAAPCRGPARRQERRGILPPRERPTHSSAGDGTAARRGGGGLGEQRRAGARRCRTHVAAVPRRPHRDRRSAVSRGNLHRDTRR